MGAISQERLLKVILAPVISEKSTRVADKLNQVVFRVCPTQPSKRLAQLFASLFKVEVVAYKC